jgi:glutathione S-transferase
MLLYEAPASPYAQKVKIALREKAVAFELELPESLGTGRTDGSFGIGNPRAEVPMLVDGQTRIFDSTIILEYIEERWPEPPLLPHEPKARAAARMTEDVCDTQYEAVTWGFSEVLWFGRATGVLATTLRSAAARQTAVLQDWLAGRLDEAAWFGGASFGWADAAVAPMLRRSALNGMGPPPGSPLLPGMSGCAIARPSPPLLRNTPRRRRACRLPWRPSRPAERSANIAIIGWSG